jgi:hypothetical protein
MTSSALSHGAAGRDSLYGQHFYPAGVGGAISRQMLRPGSPLRNREQNAAGSINRHDRTSYLRKQQWRCLGAGARPGVGDAHRETPAKRQVGGQTSYSDIGKFLRDGASGPEHQALLKLIGTLLDD